MKIMRVFVNLPNKQWYELHKGDYIFNTPIEEWCSSNPNIENISQNTFIPIVTEGNEFMVHISNFIFG